MGIKKVKNRLSLQCLDVCVCGGGLVWNLGEERENLVNIVRRYYLCFLRSVIYGLFRYLTYIYLEFTYTAFSLEQWRIYRNHKLYLLPGSLCSNQHSATTSRERVRVLGIYTENKVSQNLEEGDRNFHHDCGTERPDTGLGIRFCVLTKISTCKDKSQ